jgi:hypothetical protein
MTRPPSGAQPRNHIISESAGVLNTCRELNDLCVPKTLSVLIGEGIT